MRCFKSLGAGTLLRPEALPAWPYFCKTEPGAAIRPGTEDISGGRELIVLQGSQEEP
jgi:hypothetical protein